MFTMVPTLSGGGLERRERTGVQIGSEFKLTNGLTREAAGVCMFAVDDPNIQYPAAQNKHRYGDAHRELYGVLLIDGLDKQAIEELGKRLGRPINAQCRRLPRRFPNALGSSNGNRVNPREQCSRQLQINCR
jgi:hypothetical protein